MTTIGVLVFCLTALAVETERAPITSAQAVRHLSAEEAQEGRPVVLQGVILHFNEHAGFELTMQDDTAAIYVGGTTNLTRSLRPGQRVEITGVTSPGDFAPMVVASAIRTLGEGTFPVPRDRTFDQLATGAEDGQWVRVRGIVRTAVIDQLPNFSQLSFELATGGHRLTVRVPNVASFDPAGMVDSEATVTGICFPVFNRKRQLLTVRMRAPSLEQVTLLPPPNPATFDLPARTINSLLQFDPELPHGHRVKVSGVVTLQSAGQFLFIRDQTQGLWIKSPQSTPVRPGDVVEALGFPAFGEYNPVLEDATFIKTGTAPPPQPIRITADQARDGEFDAELVQLEAMLLNETRSPSEWILVLQAGSSIFRAHLPMRGADPPSIRTGSRLRLEGVCVIQAGDDRAPQSFRLLLRTANDVLVVSQPSWWTLPRVAAALGIMVAVSLAAFAWVLTLRRQVRIQTAEIQRKVEREAVLEERTRIAREFHDTIEQQLAAVTLQVHAARVRLAQAPETVGQLLQFAENMLRHTKAEARSSVWDLRARALESGELDAALKAVAQYVCSGSPLTASVTVTGKPHPLPGSVENHLLRIGQEAVANAVKHSGGTGIHLALEYGSEALRLDIRDDGQGFELPSATGPRQGHFGLLGMKERAERIGGDLEVISAPGAGTRIAVSVPLARLSAPKHIAAEHEETNPDTDRR